MDLHRLDQRVWFVELSAFVKGRAPPKMVPLIGDEHAELIPPRSERAAQVPVPITPGAPTSPVSDAKVDAA